MCFRGENCQANIDRFPCQLCLHRNYGATTIERNKTLVNEEVCLVFDTAKPRTNFSPNKSATDVTSARILEHQCAGLKMHFENKKERRVYRTKAAISQQKHVLM